MLRLTLLAPAPTDAQRLFRFPADDAIDSIPTSRAARLAAGIGVADSVVCGPERRCLQTAAALGLTARASAALQAWSAGTWSGRTLDWVAAHDAEGLRAWHADPGAAPHGGETLNMLLARVSNWLEDQTTVSGRWLVIADGSVLRAMLVHVLAAPPASFWRVDLSPLSVSVVQYAGGQWRLRTLDQASVAT